MIYGSYQVAGLATLSEPSLSLYGAWDSAPKSSSYASFILVSEDDRQTTQDSGRCLRALDCGCKAEVESLRCAATPLALSLVHDPSARPLGVHLGGFPALSTAYKDDPHEDLQDGMEVEVRYDHAVRNPAHDR